ncbi:hypothetical protein F5Y12DRAFT_798912 [Xylaria sp. FL1777]|nr:hypothetical protein F5Y12DRAFT_798912 [Xylaria sp. FL1777]
MNQNDSGGGRKAGDGRRPDRDGSQKGYQEKRRQSPTADSFHDDSREIPSHRRGEFNQDQSKEHDLIRQGSQIQASLTVGTGSGQVSLGLPFNVAMTTESGARQILRDLPDISSWIIGPAPPHLMAGPQCSQTQRVAAAKAASQPQAESNQSQSRLRGRDLHCTICQSNTHEAGRCRMIVNDDKLTDRQQGFKRWCPRHQSTSHTMDECRQKWIWLRDEAQVKKWLVADCAVGPAFATNLIDWRCLVDVGQTIPLPWSPEFARSKKKDEPDYYKGYFYELDPSTSCDVSRASLGWQTDNGKEPQFKSFAELKKFAEQEFHNDVPHQDDLRVIHRAMTWRIQEPLVSFWPTIFDWEVIKDGQKVMVDFHGVAAAVMLLRRMYLGWGGKNLSGGETTRLTEFAWKKEPFSDKTDPEAVQGLFGELGYSVSEGRGPTFLEVLTHDTMRHIWGTPTMCIQNQTRCVIHYDGKSPKVVSCAHTHPMVWKRGLILLQDLATLEEKVNSFINGVKPLEPPLKGTARVLCNFPPFIRIHYQAGKANTRKPVSYSEFRSFRLRQSELYSELGIEKKEHIYVLIACYFNPDKTVKSGELRLYSDNGTPLLPCNTPLEGENLHIPQSRRSLGDSDVDCILVYARMESTEKPTYGIKDPRISELPGPERDTIASERPRVSHALLERPGSRPQNDADGDTDMTGLGLHSHDLKRPHDGDHNDNPTKRGSRTSETHRGI